MVGRVGVEPTTSRLSGVRSNHLSYRPMIFPNTTMKAARALYGRAQASDRLKGNRYPEMKGHEDSGVFLELREALPDTRSGAFVQILRKEVIQPQVPLRLPCYDFTPVADPTVVSFLPCGLEHCLRVKPTPMV